MVEVTTGAGRIVWGNPLKGRHKTDDNNRPVLNDQGQPITQWAFGLAIPKAEFGHVWQMMQQEAATLFPQGVPQNYSWKYVDGDGMDNGDPQKGRAPQPYSNREGYAGHFVIAISTEAFAPRVVRLANGAYHDMMEGLKTGDFVRVALNIKGHAGKPGTRGSKPGLYLNPSMVEFLGHGQEIVSGPDAMAVFGGQQVQLPPGASATPLAPAGNMPMQPGNGAGPGPQYVAPNGQPGNGYVPQGMLPGSAPAGMPSNNGQPAQTGAYPSNPQQPGNAPMPGAPGAVPAGVNHAAPNGQPAGNGPGATAYPGNGQPVHVQPAHDFVQNATGGVMPGQPQQPGTMPMNGGYPTQH